MSRQVEIVVEADEGFAIPRADDGGEPRTWRGLCVRYRFEPARRWQKFLVEISVGQTLADALFVAVQVVALDSGNGDGVRKALHRAQHEQLGAFA